jgi:retinol-binding protein 3
MDSAAAGFGTNFPGKRDAPTRWARIPETVDMIKLQLPTALMTATMVLPWTLAGAPPALAQTAQAPSITQIDERVRDEVLNSLAQALESRYVFPGTAEKLAAAVRAKLKAHAYKDVVTAPEFARMLTNDLQAVGHDKHLRVTFSRIPMLPGPTGPLPPQMLDKLRKENREIQKLEILEGNVGYLRVNGVPPIDVSRSAIAAAFAFLHNTDALIIDDRGNGGGDPNTVAVYVSYLSEGRPFVVNTFRSREDSRVEEFKTTELGELTYGAKKPVFVLTSPATFSGGEELAYDLQALKRGVIVGEVTGGGANPVTPIEIGHQFVVAMPIAQGINPITRANWEGTGVLPDVPVAAAAALTRAHKLAIEQLASAASDVVARAELEGVSMKLEAIDEAELAGTSWLSNSELIGAYAPEAIAGTTVSIIERDGALIRRVDNGLPDRALVYLQGNRYGLEGLPDGFAISFRTSHGRVELLLEEPARTSVIRVKQ